MTSLLGKLPTETVRFLLSPLRKLARSFVAIVAPLPFEPSLFLLLEPPVLVLCVRLPDDSSDERNQLDTLAESLEESLSLAGLVTRLESRLSIWPSSASSCSPQPPGLAGG